MNLNHGDRVRVGGVDGTIFELQGCLRSWGYDEEKRAEQTARAIAADRILVGGIKRTLCITNDREQMRRENAEWDAAPRFNQGAEVTIAGQRCRLWLRQNGQCSDFLRVEVLP